MKRILILLITMFALTSCSVFYSANEIGHVTYLNVKIFQTLSKNSALADIASGSVAEVITTKDIYYDNLYLRGQFVFVGTYSYINKENTRKTVPVYMRYYEYRDLVSEGVDIKKMVLGINGI